MTRNQHSDGVLMDKALTLARAGIALVSPNPAVGAVITDSQGSIIGSGTYTYDGVKHAEILALEQAGEKARGGTLYINLEPCSHQGRTGPCAGALITAGIARVVASMQDPNPLVSGLGFAKLRDAGVAVEIGLREEEARHLNEAFARYIRHKLPLVTLKAAMTLDGKIAPPPTQAEAPGELVTDGATGGWITSEEARAHVQEIRHQSDAILVGVGTIIADDPLLTDRTGRPRRRPLLRLILDSHLRLPHTSRIVETAKDDVLVLCSFAEQKKKQALQALGIRVEQVSPPMRDGRPDMLGVIRHLGALEVTSLLIEGGAMVNWAALAAQVVDKVFLYYAPKILAGTGSVPFAGGKGYRHIKEAAYVRSFRLHRFGEDFAVEGYLRDPYES
jgi:diaminohydroxyphosphoribosylaminopyrimidine deaminase / 5-amino-6-(5-phosphoribosylamino)uracil reductase